MVADRELAISRSLVHVRELCLHFFRGDHRDMLEAEWLEDVLMEIVIQRLSCNPLKHDTCPVNANLSRRSLDVNSHRLLAAGRWLLTLYSQASPGWWTSGWLKSSAYPENSSYPTGRP